MVYRKRKKKKHAYLVFLILTFKKITGKRVKVYMVNHRKKMKVYLLLELERFVWVRLETPSNFWKPHCDRQLKRIGK